MPQIRLAQAKDLPRVTALLEQVVRVHHDGRPDLFTTTPKYAPEELLELFKNETTPVFVWADDNDVTQGYCFCKLLQNESGSCLTPIRTLYIDDLCVDAAMRGQHVGTALFRYAKEFAKAQGCYNLTLNVWAENPNARKFYEAVGLHVQKYGMETIL